MKIKFLKDVLVYGVTHKVGEVHTLDEYSNIADTEVHWCIGHVALHYLKIGEEVEIIQELSPKEKEVLFDLLDGFCAWDMGCTDSGIHDDTKRKEVKDYLEKLDPKDRSRLIFEFLNEYYMSDKAINEGHEVSSVLEFCEWIENDF